MILRLLYRPTRSVVCRTPVGRSKNNVRSDRKRPSPYERPFIEEANPLRIYPGCGFSVKSSCPDGYGLRDHLPARPALMPLIRFFVHRLAPFAPRFLSDPASRRRPCASLRLPPSGCQRDFHLRAVEHARHTMKTAGPGRAPVPADCSRCCIVISASKQLGVEP